ncbi:MAG: trehalase family glycosidase, partial [Dehalococcoidia bacterium]
MRQTEIGAIRTQAERLLRSNLRKGIDGKTGTGYKFLCPAPGEYRSQWFWDSCFHAIAMVHIDPETAKAELETLLLGQDEDGFIGHITFWGNRLFGLTQFWNYGQSRPGERLRHSGLIQPPMLAIAAEHVAAVSRDAAFLPPLMDGLDLYHNWLAEHRVPDDDGLLVVLSPYESGMDQSPAYDETLGLDGRPGRWSIGFRDRWLDFRNWLDAYDTKRMVRAARFYVKDAAVNAIYAEALAAMARMHRAQGNASVAGAYAERAALVTKSILDKMLDRGRGAFFNLTGEHERRGGPLTIGSLVPLLLEDMPADIVGEVVERHVHDQSSFWLRFPLPSVAATEPTFEPRGTGAIWRGPTWVNTNWLLWRALRRHHYDDIADTLAARTVSMVAQAGLWEYYNPLNGKGLGAKN